MSSDYERAVDRSSQQQPVVQATEGDITSQHESQSAAQSSTMGRTIVSAALLLMVGNALSRILGLVREQVIAALFGPTVETSVFTTAAAPPTMVYDLLIGGAITAALVPVFTDFRHDERELGRIAGTVATLLLLLLALVAAILMVFAPLVVSVLGATIEPAVFDQTVAMTRWLLPSVIFLGFSGLSSAILYARQRFTYPAFAIACYNAGIIVVALALAPVLDTLSLALGVLCGAIFQCLVQWPALRDLPWRFRPDLHHPGVRRILALYAPVAGGLVITILGITLDRNLAWRTGEESIAVMRFATTLVQLPLGLVGTATSFAILPALARLAGPDDEAYKRTLGLGIRMVLLLLLPATVALVYLREPVVGLLFERGVFDASATGVTARAFLFYAPQMPFVAVDQLLVVAFYARKNTLTPMLVGLFGVGVYLIVALTLIGPADLGVHGLILANTAQNSLHALVLYLLLWRAVGSLGERPLVLAIGKSVLATALGLAAIYAVTPLLPMPSNVTTRLIYLVVTGTAFATVYFTLLVAMRTDELRPVTSRLSRLGR